MYQDGKNMYRKWQNDKRQNEHNAMFNNIVWVCDDITAVKDEITGNITIRQMSERKDMIIKIGEMIRGLYLDTLDCVN